MTLILQLVAVDPLTRGIYLVGDRPGAMPVRALWLEPDAAAAFEALQAAVVAETDGPSLVFSDMYRRPSESLLAIRMKRGAQPPGWSGHNFGLSFDLATEQVLSEHPIWTYLALRQFFERFGWYGHRRDLHNGQEGWHYNYLGPPDVAARYLRQAINTRPATWSAPLETKLQEIFSEQFRVDAKSAQSTLQWLRLYAGEVDGIIGPLTVEGLRAFQRAWRLQVSGKLDADTQRTLAIVAAQHVAAPLPLPLPPAAPVGPAPSPS